MRQHSTWGLTLQIDSTDWRATEMVPENCSIDGCTKPAKTRGWCPMHYTRWRRHGDPTVTLKNGHRRTMTEVMADYVPDRPEGHCWTWRGSIDKNGYGVFNLDGLPRRAHRLSYEYFIGPIPGGLLLMHSCDTPPCVNPAHLTPGTDADNIQDCVTKGRHTFGESQWSAVLNVGDVMDIRNRVASGERYASIRNDYPNVTESTISQIARGTTWRHLPVLTVPEWRWIAPGPCRSCDRLMRPSRTTVGEYPGTIMHAGHGLCGRCKRTRNIAAKAMEEMEIAA